MSMASVKPLSGTTVLITRPGEYAGYLDEKILELGGHSIVLPTLEVKHQTEGLDENSFTTHDLAIFTSRNAVAAVAEFIDRSKIPWPESLRCAAVGTKTAESVRTAFGVQNVIAPNERFGAEALMTLQTMQNLDGQRVIFFDGGGKRSALLVHMLRTKGCVVVTHAIVYERVRPQCSTDSLAQVLQDGGVDYAVVTSVAGTLNLVDMLEPKDVNALKSATMVAYSQRIAKELAVQGFEQIVVCQSASDDAAIEAILVNKARSHHQTGHGKVHEMVDMS